MMTALDSISLALAAGHSLSSQIWSSQHFEGQPGWCFHDMSGKGPRNRSTWQHKAWWTGRVHGMLVICPKMWVARCDNVIHDWRETSTNVVLLSDAEYLRLTFHVKALEPWGSWHLQHVRSLLHTEGWREQVPFTYRCWWTMIFAATPNLRQGWHHRWGICWCLIGTDLLRAGHCPSTQNSPHIPLGYCQAVSVP